eukprot:GFYU01005975.1.p1 GENE.GFYU01005975.1~~GFYU01005975.1.p1  ORF type:complete len:352 (+),score=116.26 GFYU01005975.1:202-1257(+)
MGNKPGAQANAASKAEEMDRAESLIPEDGYAKEGGKKMAINDFDLLKVVGKGSFGKVMQVRMKDSGQIYAMKVLRKDAIIARNQVEHTKAERNILEAIQHPFIVNLHYAFQTEDKLYLIIDYVSGGELFFHLRRAGKFPLARAKFYVAQILLAIAHLHEADIIYRDLKPENLLIDNEGHAKVTDFGFAKMVEDRTFTLCGTPEYLAPEILENKGHHKGVDYWAFGVLIYEMLAGYPPFYHEDHLTMYRYILAGKIDFPKSFDSSAKDLVKKLLTKDLTKRYGCLKNGALDIKNHKWFRNTDWSSVFERKSKGPFVPELKHPGDTSNFDKYPEDDEQPKPISRDEQKLFEGF